MKNAKIQTPEVVAYEVRWKDRISNKVYIRSNFSTEAEALELRNNLNNKSVPPVWSEVYKIRTKKT